MGELKTNEMKNNLLDAYLDGFEMAKQMFVDSKTLSGFMMFGWRVNLNTNHAIKMSEYAKHDLKTKEAEEPLMSNEEINRSLIDDCNKLKGMVADYENKIEAAKNTIYECAKTIDNPIDVADFIETLDSFKMVKNTFGIIVVCTQNGITVTGSSLLDCHNKLTHK